MANCSSNAVRNGRPLTIYIYSNNRLAQEYLRQTVAQEPSYRVILWLASMSISNPPRRAVLVLELSEDLLRTEECLKYFHSTFADARIVAIGEPEAIGAIIHLLRVGVHGFVDYSMVQTTLCDAIRNVANNQIWFPPEVLQNVAKRVYSRASQRNICDEITPRELEVLGLLKQRLSNKEIGSILRIRECTVKYHVSNILGKLQVANRRVLFHCEFLIKGPEDSATATPGKRQQ